MGLLGIFLHLVLAGNLVLASGTGIDLVLYRQRHRGDGLLLFLQCLVFLTIPALLFWLVYRFVLQPLQLDSLWVLVALSLLGGAKALLSLAAQRSSVAAPGSGAANGLASSATERPPSAVARILFSGSEYGNFYSSSLSFGFLCLVVLGQWDILQLLLAALGAGLGVGLVTWICDQIRGGLSLEKLHRSTKGEASHLLMLGLLSLAFSFFDRLIVLM